MSIAGFSLPCLCLHSWLNDPSQMKPTLFHVTVSAVDGLLQCRSHYDHFNPSSYQAAGTNAGCLRCGKALHASCLPATLVVSGAISHLVWVVRVSK